MLTLALATRPALGAESFTWTVAAQTNGGYVASDIVQLNDGTLLLAYALPYWPSDRAIYQKKSWDQGKHWVTANTILVPAPPSPAIVDVPSFLRLGNGKLLLSYAYNAMTDPAVYSGYNYGQISSNEGQSWGAPYVITPGTGLIQAASDRLLTLSMGPHKGRIVNAAQYAAHATGGGAAGDPLGFVGLDYYSDDMGATWHRSSNTVDMYQNGGNIEVQEPDVVELKDGRLMMFARSYSGHPVRAYSSDQGESWGAGQLITELPMPSAGLPTVRRIPATGDLLFMWISETNGGRRTALSSAISTDEGQTFTHIQNIVRDPNGNFGYQSVTFLGNDMSLVSYHATDGIRVARIPISWYYEGAIVLPEPSTLVLLATGLIGLLAYAWRKRK